eukprot:540639_1
MFKFISFVVILFNVVYGGTLSSFQVDGSNLVPNDLGSSGYAQTKDNRLFIFGGRSGTADANFPACPGECDDAFVFDLEDETWITMHHALIEEFYCSVKCAAAMSDNLIYIMGHTGETWGEVFKFNTNTLQFEASISTPINFRTRYGCVATDYDNGKIYYFGGIEQGSQVPKAEILIYNINTQTWDTSSPNPGVNGYNIFAPLCAFSNGNYYSFGGRIFDGSNNNNGGPVHYIWKYNIANDVWTRISGAEGFQKDFISARLIEANNGLFYIAGGENPSAAPDPWVANTYSFDPNTETLTTEPNLNDGVTAFVMSNYGNTIRIWGGNYGSNGQYGLNYKSNMYATYQTPAPTTEIPSESPTQKPIYVPGNGDHCTVFDIDAMLDDCSYLFDEQVDDISDCNQRIDTVNTRIDTLINEVSIFWSNNPAAKAHTHSIIDNAGNNINGKKPYFYYKDLLIVLSFALNV